MAPTLMTGRGGRSVGVTGSTSSEGIVVESTLIGDLSTKRCDVHGTIRNTTADGHRRLAAA